jgi:AAA ATPase domain
MDRTENPPGGGVGTGTLASRLARVDEERFVGRMAELAALERCLDDDETFRVVHVFGPGGIGKSSLLREFARRAQDRGFTAFAVEGRELPPSPDALEAILSDAATASHPLVLIDTYERMTGLAGYLRRGLLPSLPATAVVVIAGRNAPEESWFQDGWEGVVSELELDKLPAGDARALLAAHGLTDERTEPVVDWADGSPLALTLAAGAAAADGGWTPRADRESPEILRSLIRRLAEAEIRTVRFSVLAVSAIARVTTPEMLDAVLPAGDAQGAYERLRTLSFSEAVGDGLALHELVRKALRADLRRRAPERDRELRRRITDHLFERAQGGDPLMAIEMAALIDNPVIRWGFGWEGSIDYRIDDVRPGDEQRLAELMSERHLEDWWALTRRFVSDAPDRVAMARDRDDHVCGFLSYMSPASAPPFADEDPIVGPQLAHARSDAHLGDAVLWHDTFDFTGWPAGERADRGFSGSGGRVKAMLGMAGILRAGVLNPRFMYLPINPENEGARAFAQAAGGTHLPELDCRLADHTVECHRIDHGPGGLFGSLRGFVYMELGLTVPAQAAGGAAAAPVVDRELVRDALRNFHVPHALSASRLARGDTPEQRVESVRTLLHGAADAAFGDSHNERLLKRVLTLGYLETDPARPSHEQVAHDLALSRAAYFRRLRVAADRVADHLAQTSRAD